MPFLLPPFFQPHSAESPAPLQDLAALLQAFLETAARSLQIDILATQGRSRQNKLRNQMESEVLSQLGRGVSATSTRNYLAMQSSTLFRSCLQASFLYQTLLTTLQSILLTLCLTSFKDQAGKGSLFNFSAPCETTCQLVQSTVECIVSKCLEKDQEEQQSFQQLLSTLVSDLEQSLSCFSLELPVFVWFLKALSMTLVAQANKFLIDPKASQDKEELPLQSKLWLLTILSRIAKSLSQFQVKTEAQISGKECFCGNEPPSDKSEEVFSCSKCHSKVHKNCCGDTSDDPLCLRCDFLGQDQIQLSQGSSISNAAETLLQFCKNFTSSYQDFRPASLCWLAVTLKLSKGKESQSEIQGLVSMAISELEYQQKSKSTAEQNRWAWSNSAQVEHSRALASALLFKAEFEQLNLVLTSVLLCASYSHQATVRSRCMKTIKSLIETKPALLLDPQIANIIKLRVQDVSSTTRDSALELLQKHLLPLLNQGQEGLSTFDSYLQMVFQILSSETNATVKRRVISILSGLLESSTDTGNSQMSEQTKDKVIGVIIGKLIEEDQLVIGANSVQQTLVACVQKLIKAEAKKGKDKQSILQSILAKQVELHFKSFQEAFNEQNLSPSWALLPHELANCLTLESVFLEILRGSFSKDKKFIDQIGGTLLTQNLDALYHGRDNREVVYRSLTMTKIIGKAKPQLVRDHIRSILKAQQFLSSPELKEMENPLSGLFASVLAQALKDVGDEEDWITSESSLRIQKVGADLVQKGSIQIMELGLQLCSSMASFTRDIKQVASLLTNSLVILKSISITSKPGLSAAAVGRVFLTACGIVAECEQISKMEEFFKVNFKTEVMSLACSVLQTFSDDVVDLVLQGVSKVWLKFPEVLMSESQEDNLLQTVVKRVQEDRVKDESKVKIVESIYHFILNLRSSNSSTDLLPLQKKLEVEIQSLLGFTSNQNPSLRLSSLKFFQESSRHFTQKSSFETISLFLAMMGDCSAEVRDLALRQLNGFVKTKPEHLVMSFGCSKDLFFSVFDHQLRIGLPFPSGFKRQQTAASGKRKKARELWFDEGLFDSVLTSIQAENSSFCDRIVHNFITFGSQGSLVESVSSEEWNIKRKIFFVKAYLEVVVMSACFARPSAGSTKHFLVQAELQNYLSLHELSCLKKLKQLKLEEAALEDFEESQEVILEGLVALGFKMVEKQLSKMASKLDARDSEGKKEARQPLKYALKTSQALDNLFFNFKDFSLTQLSVKQLQNFGEELTLLLRNLVHEDDDKLRLRMQKQIERNIEVGRRASGGEGETATEKRRGKKRRTL